MEKVKVIVFDLFETLLHDVKFDFDAVLSYLYKNILSENIDRGEFLFYASTYWRELYDQRSKDNLESAFDDELIDFKNKYGFKVDYSLEEILFNCALEMGTTELFNDTISTLEQLKSFSIPLYLLSNSIFKKDIMKKIISQYDLEKYFVDTYFSADYNIKKPNKDLFKVVFDDIKKNDLDIEKGQVYFIGDDYNADVLGAKNFGFTPVFLNRKHNLDINSNNFIEIKSLNELLEIIK